MGKFNGKKCRLLTVMSLTISFFFVEIVTGYITNSMSLVADSFHMLGDIAALVISFLSVKMSPKKWSKNTFGWARAEVLGALINAVFLVALCFSISVESIKRFIHPEIIHGAENILFVGFIGLMVNVVGLCLLYDSGGHGHSHGHNKLSQLSSVDDNENEDYIFGEPHKVKAPSPVKKASSGHGHSHSHSAGQMNMRAAFLHVLSDALGSVIVMISAVIIKYSEWEYKFYCDPAMSMLLVVLILHSVWPLLRESALILLQTVPTHIEVDAIQRRLLERVDGVLAIHEFHVWQLAGDRIIASAHIRCRNLSEYMKLAEKVKEFFHNEGIHSTTIQPEFIEIETLNSCTTSDGISTNLNINGKEEGCVLDCPNIDENCVKATCCQNVNNKAQQPSPSSSPYLCRQRQRNNVENNEAGEKGSLLQNVQAHPVIGSMTNPAQQSASENQTNLLV
ncbi:CLUMA_CG012659, isoform A [Clunio marinus]|uniref:CLUMA_CG012659, isoform A n=1 Tax=Clunio marinus TaxID=568069 RepID=A0A1J1IIR6_9DIPT|nr:CLUMA_CG012659, isoform A [Clunio marinus]